MQSPWDPTNHWEIRLTQQWIQLTTLWIQLIRLVSLECLVISPIILKSSYRSIRLPQFKAMKHNCRYPTRISNMLTCALKVKYMYIKFPHVDMIPSEDRFYTSSCNKKKHQQMVHCDCMLFILVYHFVSSTTIPKN